MEDQSINLSICQICKERSAIYGDGLTWSRCSACQQQQPVSEQPIIEGEGFKHQLIPGLVSIIMPIYMVNYSLFHYTGNAIGSIREHTDENKYELIIVDNGSPIQPPSLESYYAKKIIPWIENKGVTKAWNAGIRCSFGEYIVLINNDVQVYEGWLEGLKKAIDEEGYDLAMAHPMYSLTEPFARAIESKQVLEGQKRFDNLEKDFSCVMFKKSLMDEVGMFDEQFFSYCSDVDLFRRMEEAGKKYGIIDSVAVHHLIDATGYAIPETPQIMDEDKAKFEEKWNKPKYHPDPEEGEIIPEHTSPSSSVSVCVSSLNLVRTSFTGDRIFLIKDNQTHWIKNPETLEALGGEFGMVKVLDREEFNKFTKGEDIDMANAERYRHAPL